MVTAVTAPAPIPMDATLPECYPPASLLALQATEALPALPRPVLSLPVLLRPVHPAPTLKDPVPTLTLTLEVAE